MRAHGVPNFPYPVGGHITLDPSSGIDPDSSTFQAAVRACAALAPSGGGAGATTGTADPGSGVTAATWREFGQWLASRAAAGEFSGAALVAQRDTVRLRAGYGQADRASGTRNTADTTFCIASIGKLFTAVAIAQLVQDHKLSFGDTLGRYLTGFVPAAADHITIADLLDMTAGYGNVALTSVPRPTTLAAQIRLIASEQPQFTPGSTFRYSNDGYIVLGAIIERVTGSSYPGYVRRHILEPAGMTHTTLTPYTPASIRGMAHGYTLRGTSGTAPRDISDQLHIANPSGGAAATVDDLLRFSQALLDHRLLSPAMTATVLAPRVKTHQPGGTPDNAYTYGFGYHAINGVTFVGHNGGTAGYQGQLDIYPKAGYVVVILTNQEGASVPAIRRSEAILTGS
jgi:CubicO group peptidase (beta-lactamase class C family)